MAAKSSRTIRPARAEFAERAPGRQSGTDAFVCQPARQPDYLTTSQPSLASSDTFLSPASPAARRSRTGHRFSWPVVFVARRCPCETGDKNRSPLPRRFPIQLALHGIPSEGFHRPYGTRSFGRAALHARRRRVSRRSAAGLVAGGRNRFGHLSQPGAPPAGLSVQQLRL